MEQPTITTKIRLFVEKELCNNCETFIDKVSRGDLAGFESDLWKLIGQFYNLVAEGVLEASAQAAQGELRQKARALGLGKLEERPMRVQIRTGH